MAVSPTVSPVYTSQTEITYRVTAAFITSITGGDADTLTYVIYQATDDFNTYTLNYDDTDKSNSSWCRTRCTDIACYHLATLKGNPPHSGILARYERTMLELERVRKCEVQIPGLAYNNTILPSYENIRVMQIPRVMKARVETLLSDPSAAQFPLQIDPTGLFDVWWGGY